jgi:hypothetical protein
MNPRLEHQAFRIHQQMALSPFHLLSGVKAALVSSHSRGLRGPGIYDPGAGVLVPAELRDRNRSRSSAFRRFHVPSMRHLLNQS